MTLKDINARQKLTRVCISDRSPSCIPGVFDEIDPGKPSGTRPPLGVENLKRIVEIGSSTQLAARHKDISFAAGQPKLFTSNALSLNDWLPDIPKDIYTMSNADFLKLPPSVVAVIRRCLFWHISSSYIPQDVRNQFKRRRHSVLPSNVQTALGGFVVP